MKRNIIIFSCVSVVLTCAAAHAVSVDYDGDEIYKIEYKRDQGKK